VVAQMTAARFAKKARYAQMEIALKKLGRAKVIRNSALHQIKYLGNKPLLTSMGLWHKLTLPGPKFLLFENDNRHKSFSGTCFIVAAT
jgi:hypothetical protein